jgi:hypothetical protein
MVKPFPPERHASEHRGDGARWGAAADSGEYAEAIDQQSYSQQRDQMNITSRVKPVRGCLSCCRGCVAAFVQSTYRDNADSGKPLSGTCESAELPVGARNSFH